MGRSLAVIRAVLPVVVALVSMAGTAVAVVSPHFVANDAYCETRVGVGATGFSLPLLGGVTVTPITTADGETDRSSRAAWWIRTSS